MKRLTIQEIKATFQSLLDNLSEDESINREIPYYLSKSQVKALAAMIAADGFSVKTHREAEDRFITIFRPSNALAESTPFWQAAKIKLLEKLNRLAFLHYYQGLIVSSTPKHWIISFSILGFSFSGLAKRNPLDSRWDGWAIGSVLKTKFLRHDAEGSIYVEVA